MRLTALVLATLLTASLGTSAALACGFKAKDQTVQAPQTPLPTQTASTQSGS